MHAEDVFNRRQIGRVIEVTFKEHEMLPTKGDRKRGSNDRREARVESLRLAYFWSFDKHEWIAETMASAQVSQRLASGEWAKPVQRNIWGVKGLDELRKEFTPKTTITIVEE